jgi:hypothetical protein
VVSDQVLVLLAGDLAKRLIGLKSFDETYHLRFVAGREALSLG